MALEPTAAQRTVHVTGLDPSAVLGHRDAWLRELETRVPGVRYSVRGDRVTLTGPASELDRGEQALRRLMHIAEQSREVTVHDVRAAASESGPTVRPPILTSRGRAIRAQTEGQRRYVDTITEHEVTFGLGPAGTGKTYLAMATAVQALQRREISRIVLTRPAVEAGERLGYLPGTLEDKIDPYLRPLFDAMGVMLEAETVQQLLANGTIEIAPLAFMRGRTLNESFVILDEAQNTTPEQMKMFLTRLGFDSRMVITGDLTQADLSIARSGLADAVRVLRSVDGVGMVHLTPDDIVRHALVGRIVEAYDTQENP